MDDEGRFDEFYRVEYARLVGALSLVTGSRAEAQDAVDEALARAWEQLGRGRELASLSAWARVTAMNLARGLLRRRAVERRARARLAASDLVGPDDDTTLTVLDVRRALAELSRRQREVAVLHYLLDLPVAQIAVELRIREGTVKSMLSRARAALATLITSKASEVDHDTPA